MSAIGPAIIDPLAPPGDALPLLFRSLEDFHPDQLVRRVEAFGRLRSIHGRLRDATAAAAARRELAEVLGFDPAAAGGGIEAGSAEGGPSRSGAEEFAALLGADAPGPPREQKKSGFDVESFVRSMVQAHVVKGADGREGVYLAAADAALSALMRRLMHAPAFRELEAAWRGVHRLVTTLETGENLTVHLLDASREEIVADLAAAARASAAAGSGLSAQIVESRALAADGESWGLIAGCMTFGRTVQDAALLSGLAQVAALTGAPFLAGGAPSFVGCGSFAAGADPSTWSTPQDGAARAWQMLRSTEESRYVALGMPRVLLRVPFGAGGERADSFAFDELPAAPGGAKASQDRERHEAYLWGHPGLVLAEALALAFQDDGWSMDAGAADDVTGLPVHSFNEGPGAAGPKRVMACAETWLTERGAHVIRQAGVTPIMSIKGRDAVRVPGIVSLHQSGDALSGRWG
jgi:type VI secretion system ImpC/EvpB family protein